MRKLTKMLGVTLFEILLVMVILGSILVLFVNYTQQKSEERRRIRVSWQMQMILNAALSYYTVNNQWPSDLSSLQANSRYLPQEPFLNPWGKSYFIVSRSGIGMFYVFTNVTTENNAINIVGKLPLAYYTSSVTLGQIPVPSSCSGTSRCYVVASVNIPGQNLNEATGVSFGSIYHSGSCVPAPDCTVNKNGAPMKPQIMVIPVSVAGVNDAITSAVDAKCVPDAQNHFYCAGPFKAYPLVNYSARAIGDESGAPIDVSETKRISTCDGAGTGPCDADMTTTSTPPLYTAETGKKYWRVCLEVITDKGKVSPVYSTDNRGNFWGQSMGTVLAITRCVPNNENTGSNFHVWSP